MGSRRRSGRRLANRELSWLDFDERVLALAEDPAQPLLERVRYCAIVSANLDEFFQVRVAGLKDQVAAGVTAPAPDGRSAGEQLEEIRARVEALVARQQRAFLDDLVPSLEAAHVTVARWADLDEADHKALVEEFHERIFPVLTPLAVDPSHPFPYMSDLSLNLAVIVRRPDGGSPRFARVKMPSLLPRFVQVPGAARFVPIEDVVAAHLDVLFPGVEIVSAHAFRVTRNADLTPEEEEADDLLAAVEMELRRRRFQRAVRLEVSDDLPDTVADLLAQELELEADGVYRSRAPLDLAGLFDVAELDRPDLRHPPLVPVTEPCFAAPEAEEADLFAADPPTATCSSTIPTRPSPPRWRPSSPRRRPTPVSSPSR